MGQDTNLVSFNNAFHKEIPKYDTKYELQLLKTRSVTKTVYEETLTPSVNTTLTKVKTLLSLCNMNLTMK